MHRRALDAVNTKGRSIHRLTMPVCAAAFNVNALCKSNANRYENRTRRPSTSDYDNGELTERRETADDAQQRSWLRQRRRHTAAAAAAAAAASWCRHTTNQLPATPADNAALSAKYASHISRLILFNLTHYIFNFIRRKTTTEKQQQQTDRQTDR